MTKPPGRRLAAALFALAGAAVALFGVLAPPEECPQVTADELREAADEAVAWFARNQNPDGTWLYLWDERADAEGNEVYNGVRHAGAIMGLYQAAAAEMDGALASADRGMRWVEPRLVGSSGWAAIKERGTVPAGATALLTSGLVERRLATGDERHDALLRRLGNFLAGQVEASGAVLAYFDTDEGRPTPGLYSKYYTGEAYWALARLHRLFPDGGFGEAADRVGRYLATRRDDVEDLFPPIPDHWAAYGLAETVAFPRRLSADEVAYTRRQAGLWAAQVRWVSQQAGPWGSAVRGADKPRGGGYGVIGEGLTGLWQTAGADARLADLRRPVGERATCIAALALEEQRSEAEAARSPSPGKVRGAWFIDGLTRMDDQQHALSALLRTVPIVAATDDGAGDRSGRAQPSLALWLIALIAALSPARAALTVPVDGRPRCEVLTVALLGTVVGGAVVLVAALVADPLADALDVSAPGLRIGAGILGALAGLVDVFRRPPSPEPAMAGRLAALVPVAFPAVARPPLVMLALSAGADRGLPVVLAALVVGGGAVVALAAAPRTPAGARVLHWAGRLLGAVLAVAGTALVINGVFDV